jgi:hypothetical protein
VDGLARLNHGRVFQRRIVGENRHVHKSLPRRGIDQITRWFRPFVLETEIFVAKPFLADECRRFGPDTLNRSTLAKNARLALRG